MRSPGRRPRRLGPWLLAGAVLAAGVAAAVRWATPTTVRAVAIAGLRHLSRAEADRLVGVKPGDRLGPRAVRELAARLGQHPAFDSAEIHRGVTGVLHVALHEREPLVWLLDRRCAVATDGTLLRHLANRRAEWVAVSGVPCASGRVLSPGLLREAAEAERLTGDGSAESVWRFAPGAPGWWELVGDGKVVRLASPVTVIQMKRLRRFQREYPEAWGRARRLDLRFADRVVVTR